MNKDVCEAFNFTRRLQSHSKNTVLQVIDRLQVTLCCYDFNVLDSDVHTGASGQTR